MKLVAPQQEADFGSEGEPGEGEIESIVKWLSGSSDSVESYYPTDYEQETASDAKQPEAVQEAAPQMQDTERGKLLSEIANLKIKLMEANSSSEKMKLELKAMETVASVSAPSDLAQKLSVTVKTNLSLEQKVKERDRQLDDLRNELRVKEQDLKNLTDKMSFKDDEFNKREVDLQHREELMKEQLKKVEMNKLEMGGMKEIELKKSLEDLREQIKLKEEKIKSLEKYLSSKEEELDRREKALIGKEVELIEELTIAELKQEKVKSGTPRLDDLLYGGVPVGAQVVIYGPPFVGKEVVMNAFAAEGLKRGVPVIWVTTDHTIREIREEMSYVLNSFEEYEKLGLLWYVDAYSRSIGDNSSAESAVYIEDFNDVDQIGTHVEKKLEALRDIVDKKGYRIIFRSISSLTALYEMKNIFKIMRPFVARRKRDKCTAMYCVEKGIVSDQDVQIIGSIMDGIIEFETDGQSNFLSIKGIAETQTRDRVKYTAGKNALSIGSFSLGHIR